MRLVVLMLSLAWIFVLNTQTFAARGACDGIHRCTCGSTLARHLGFPRIYNGYNLWQAKEWARAFPHTSLQAGAIGVKPHHVYRVVQVIGNGNAIVADEKGTYERKVAGDIFVDANGNGSRIAEPKRTHTTTASAKSHREYRRQHRQFVPSFDRLTASY